MSSEGREVQFVSGERHAEGVWATGSVHSV